MRKLSKNKVGVSVWCGTCGRTKKPYGRDKAEKK